MAIRSEKEIYQVLEEYLRIQEQPVTCTDLMDIPGIRKAALEEFGPDVRIATNGISDTLGFMWRRELLTRYPAPKDSRTLARYAYQWSKKVGANNPSVSLPPVAKGKTAVNITERDGGVPSLQHATSHHRVDGCYEDSHKTMSACQVVAGNPVEGFRFIGPFTQSHFAAEWADEWILDSDWWVVTLETNKEYENGNKQAK